MTLLLSSLNSQAGIGRTSATTGAARYRSFGCSNRMGAPSAGTTAHRTNAPLEYTVIAAVPVA